MDWEYTTTEKTVGGLFSSKDALKEMPKQGWELVSVAAVGPSGRQILYWKRRR